MVDTCFEQPGKATSGSSGSSVRSRRLRMGVVFGPFAERNQAADALEALPENLKQFRPYVRSIDALREDVRRAPPIP